MLEIVGQGPISMQINTLQSVLQTSRIIARSGSFGSDPEWERVHTGCRNQGTDLKF